jgi:hypothetical protein
MFISRDLTTRTERFAFCLNLKLNTALSTRPALEINISASDQCLGITLYLKIRMFRGSDCLDSLYWPEYRQMNE